MVITVPSFTVSFHSPNRASWMKWTVYGDKDLEAVCRVLRQNGITEYTVGPSKNFGQPIDV